MGPGFVDWAAIGAKNYLRKYIIPSQFERATAHALAQVQSADGAGLRRLGGRRRQGQLAAAAGSAALCQAQGGRRHGGRGGAAAGPGDQSTRPPVEDRLPAAAGCAVCCSRFPSKLLVSMEVPPNCSESGRQSARPPVEYCLPAAAGCAVYPVVSLKSSNCRLPARPPVDDGPPEPGAISAFPVA